jgi:large subunit ribosomal protein L4
MNTKTKKKAMISAVALKARSTQLYGWDELNLEEVKTKAVADILNTMPFMGSKTLIVLPEHNDTQQKSIRNLAKAKYVVADKLNPYDLMSWKHVVFV